MVSCHGTSLRAVLYPSITWYVVIVCHFHASVSWFCIVCSSCVISLMLTSLTLPYLYIFKCQTEHGPALHFSFAKLRRPAFCKGAPPSHLVKLYKIYSAHKRTAK